MEKNTRFLWDASRSYPFSYSMVATELICYFLHNLLADDMMINKAPFLHRATKSKYLKLLENCSMQHAQTHEMLCYWIAIE